jgi:hypothetical protein
MSRSDELAERKARLIAQADLQRMQALLAWQMTRSIVAPPAAETRSRGSRAVAATLIGFSLPFMGAGRMRRMVRAVSIGITVLRALRAWRGSGR